VKVVKESQKRFIVWVIKRCRSGFALLGLKGLETRVTA